MRRKKQSSGGGGDRRAPPAIEGAAAWAGESIVVLSSIVSTLKSLFEDVRSGGSGRASERERWRQRERIGPNKKRALE